MIRFIICDDNKDFAILLRKKVSEFMKSHSEIECRFNSFLGYGKEFEEIIQSPDSYKVYFLDIETKKGSGLDAARMIREKYDDWNSVVIIVTSHEEFRYEALGNRLYLFDFINKLNNLDKTLEEDLDNILKQYTRSSNSITFEYDYTLHNVELRDIVYVEKQLDSKKCTVATTYGVKEVQSSLNDIYKKLNNNFMKVSRSLIVNIKKIKAYDVKTNTLNFINGYTSNLVSRDCKKELIERVKNNI